MLGKKMFLEVIEHLRSYINVQNISILERCDKIEQELAEIKELLASSKEQKPSGMFRDENGLLSYKAHDDKMRDYYDRPKDVR